MNTGDCINPGAKRLGHRANSPACQAALFFRLMEGLLWRVMQIADYFLLLPCFFRPLRGLDILLTPAFPRLAPGATIWRPLRGLHPRRRLTVGIYDAPTTSVV
jgi:hypothetical protein